MESAEKFYISALNPKASAKNPTDTAIHPTVNPEDSAVDTNKPSAKRRNTLRSALDPTSEEVEF